jgi:nucleolar protein 14
MPSSQLKRLKASLRDQGIIGPQKSKKQKRNSARDAANGTQRVSRAAALENIREQFNPFEFTHSRGPKFPAMTNRPGSKGIKGRPGVSKAVAEEKVKIRWQAPQGKRQC